jgi:hypothetical protein
MNDNTRRFMTGILERVAEARVVELRLFPAIRQGGVESAVAVIAVEPPPEVAAEAVENDERAAGAADDSRIPNPESRVPDAESRIPNLESRVEDSASPEESVLAAQPLPPDDERETQHDDEPDDSATPPAAVVERIAERVAELRVSFDGPGLAAPDAPPQDNITDREVAVRASADDRLPDEPEESIALSDILALPEPVRRRPSTPHPERLQILSAWYRLVFKGPDRGKWDIEIVHEADAPLETLERVVQGVARRSGDTAEPELYSAQSLREALDQPAWV